MIQSDIINDKILLELRKICKYAKFPLKRKDSKSYNLAVRGEIKGEIEMKMSAKAVCSNMQDDMVAFEAWCLILIGNKIAKTIKLKWDVPDNNLNYNRFLFRVNYFIQLFDWVTIEDSVNIQEITKFKKAYYKNKLIINEPSDRQIDEIEKDDNSLNTEAQLEKYIVENGVEAISKQIDLNLQNLNRQLPVGLFKENVKKDNSVFTGGKSAIDIFGVDYDKKTIAIFELKCSKNEKVGILSELLFYTMFIIEMLQQNFVFADTGTKNKNRRIQVDKIERLKACFLVEKLHVLLDNNIIDLLNQAFDKKLVLLTNNKIKKVEFLVLYYKISSMIISCRDYKK